MDLLKILAEMHQERDRLKTIIASLEAMQRPPAKPASRGERKGMDGAARKAASQRMKRYWAARKQKDSTGAEPAEPSAEVQ